MALIGGGRPSPGRLSSSSRASAISDQHRPGEHAEQRGWRPAARAPARRRRGRRSASTAATIPPRESVIQSASITAGSARDRARAHPRAAGRCREPAEQDDRRGHRRGEPVPVADRVGEPAERSPGGPRRARRPDCRTTTARSAASERDRADQRQPDREPRSQGRASPRREATTTSTKSAEVGQRPDHVLEGVAVVARPGERERDQRREAGEREPGDDRRARRLGPRQNARSPARPATSDPDDQRRRRRTRSARSRLRPARARRSRPQLRL